MVILLGFTEILKSHHIEAVYSGFPGLSRKGPRCFE